jgi:hypothetical protein
MCLNKHRKDKQLNNKHRLNIYKEEEKNIARTSKGSNLPNLPLVEGARRSEPSGLKF